MTSSLSAWASRLRRRCIACRVSVLGLTFVAHDRGQPFAFADGFAVLRAWRAERMSLARFGPLALLLAGAAILGSAPGWESFVAAACIALLLLAQFRLWDDLVDVGRDRSEHPERVLTWASDRRVVLAACVVLGVVNAFVLYCYAGPIALSSFALFNVLLGAWYGLHAGRGLWHLHVLLLKYPVFVLLLGAPASTMTTLAGAAAIYAAICLFELLDGNARHHSVTPALLLVHGLSLSVLACAPHVDGAGLGIGIGIAGVIAFACIGAPRRGFVERTRRYAPFLAALIVLVRLALGDAP